MMALYKNGEPINLLDAYDTILDALGITIAGQNITLLTKLSGVDQSVSVLSSGVTITAGTGDYDFDKLELDSYSQVDFVLDLSLAAGKCTISVMQSQDGSTYKDVPFRVNSGTEVVSHEYNSGDASPLLISVRRFGKDVKLRITDDGTNDVTVNFLWATRRVL